MGTYFVSAGMGSTGGKTRGIPVGGFGIRMAIIAIRAVVMVCE